MSPPDPAPRHVHCLERWQQRAHCRRSLPKRAHMVCQGAQPRRGAPQQGVCRGSGAACLRADASSKVRLSVAMAEPVSTPCLHPPLAVQQEADGQHVLLHWLPGRGLAMPGFDGHRARLAVGTQALACESTGLQPPPGAACVIEVGAAVRIPRACTTHSTPSAAEVNDCWRRGRHSMGCAYVRG